MLLVPMLGKNILQNNSLDMKNVISEVNWNMRVLSGTHITYYSKTIESAEKNPKTIIFQSSTKCLTPIL